MIKLTQKKLYISLLILAVFSVVSILFIDLPIAKLIHKHKFEALNYIFEPITMLGKGAVLIFLSLILTIFFWLFAYSKKSRYHYINMAKIFAFILLTNIVSGIVVNIFKFIFGRTRPMKFFENGFYKFAPFHTFNGSFPSGHATSIAATALALIIFFPKYTKIFIIVVLLVLISRMILEMHFLSDVVSGTYVGSITTIYLYKITKAYMRI